MDAPAEPRCRLLVPALLALVLGAAGGLRLVEPLANGVMAAQDPYMHLAHARSVLEGGAWPLEDRGGVLPRPHYPPGLHALFAAVVAVTGWPRYEVARFAPALFGALGAAATFLLAASLLRGRGRDAAATGGLVAAAAVATAPEVVFRSNLLQPSALDVLLVPLLLLALLEALRGKRAHRAGWSILAALALVALLLAHPWVTGLLAPGLLVYALLDRDLPRRTRAAAGGAAIALALAGAAFLASGNYFLLTPERTLRRLAAIASDPGRGLGAWPAFVDYPRMAGTPLLFASVVGAVVALARPRGAAALGLGLGAFLLPFTRVDWLGLWYLPHRSVLYLLLAAALLAGVGAAAAVAAVSFRSVGAGRVAVSAVALLAVTTGSVAGLATPAWYHLYGEADHNAARLLAAEADHVIVGSWEGRWLVRALTDTPWTWSKPFFRDPVARDATLAEIHAGGATRVHVLVEHGVWMGAYGRRGPAYDLAFLGSNEWRLVYARSDVLVYDWQGIAPVEGPPRPDP